MEHLDMSKLSKHSPTSQCQQGEQTNLSQLQEQQHLDMSGLTQKSMSLFREMESPEFHQISRPRYQQWSRKPASLTLPLSNVDNCMSVQRGASSKLPASLPPLSPGSGSRHGKGVGAAADILHTQQGVQAGAKNQRRVMQSRQYSQKYRLKQIHYMAHLESELKVLQAEVAINSPRIKYCDSQNTLLRAENFSIRERLSAQINHLVTKEAEYKELKKERDALRKLYALYQQRAGEIMQQLRNMGMTDQQQSAEHIHFKNKELAEASQDQADQNSRDQ